MHLMTIIALTAATLTSPPMQIDWATAEIRIGSEEQAEEALCGIEDANVLIVIAQQISTDGLPMPDPDLSWKALLEEIR